MTEAADERLEAGLRLEGHGPVATITLARPESRNAQSPAMWETWSEIRSRRAATYGWSSSGRGELVQRRTRQADVTRRASRGDVVPQLEELDDGDGRVIATFQDAFSAWRRPTSSGSPLSRGTPSAQASSSRWPATSACSADARFAMLETSLGLVPDLGGTQPLVEAVGYPRALEICVTGRWVDADEARQLGLATIVVRREDVDGTVSDLAEAVTAPLHKAVTATKELLRSATGRGYTDQLVRSGSPRYATWPRSSRRWTGPRGVGNKGAEQVFCRHDGAPNQPDADGVLIRARTRRRTARPDAGTTPRVRVRPPVHQAGRRVPRPRRGRRPARRGWPLLFKRIVDNGIPEGDGGSRHRIALLVARLAFAEAVLTLAQRWYSSRIGEGLIYDSGRVFGHVQRMPLAFFSRTHTGALVSRLNNDVIGAQRAFTSTLSGVVSNVISLRLVAAVMLVCRGRSP